ncbi:MAG: lysophospholipid acyltransferase family protein [Planctomycetaceae bacterium]
MDVRKLRYLLEYLFFCAVVFVMQSLPVGSVVRLADLTAWMVHRVVPRRMNRYHIAADNLRTAFGDELTDEQVDQIIGGMWRHLARMVCEVIQLQRRFRLYNCTDVLRFYQRNECVQAIMQGRPVLFLGGHFGNWEVSVNTFGHFGFPMGVVARDLDNPWLQEWFRRFRESTGNWVVSKTGASVELVTAMEEKRNASLLCDQDAGRRGVFVDFFGKPASTFKSIALLALQHDALIVVGGAWRLADAEQKDSRWRNFELATEAIIDSRDFDQADAVQQLTQRFTTALEQLIRRAPEQYFWLHRRWKTVAMANRRKERQQAA